MIRKTKKMQNMTPIHHERRHSVYSNPSWYNLLYTFANYIIIIYMTSW
jgi:hypothetical protein